MDGEKTFLTLLLCYSLVTAVCKNLYFPRLLNVLNMTEKIQMLEDTTEFEGSMKDKE